MMWRRATFSSAAIIFVVGAVAVALALDHRIAHPVGVLRILAFGAGGVSFAAQGFFPGNTSQSRLAEMLSYARIFLFPFAGPHATDSPFDTSTMVLAFALDGVMVALGIAAGFIASKSASSEVLAAMRERMSDDRSTLLWLPIVAVLLVAPTAWTRDWTTGYIAVGIAIVAMFGVMVIRRLRQRGPAAGLKV